MKSNKKLNDGCLKIFRLLKLLYEDKADYSSVIEIFKGDLNEQSTNNIQVVLNKYMNALKIFGIKVVKVNNKYKLLNSMYFVDLSLEDLKSINILANSIKDFPDEDITQEITELLNSIKFRMNNKDKNTLNNLSNNTNYDFKFYYADLKEQLKQCKEICKLGHIVYILYLQNGEETRCKCTPRDVIYDSKTAYLQIYDLTSRQNIEIPINNILSINKLPQLSNSIEMPTTVVYKLKNRLAQTYKIKENEYSTGHDEDGNLIIVNKNEPFDKLLHRLMRYSFNCEIISPKYMRDDMIKLINETLNNYKDET